MQVGEEDVPLFLRCDSSAQQWILGRGLRNTLREGMAICSICFLLLQKEPYWPPTPPTPPHPTPEAAGLYSPGTQPFSGVWPDNMTRMQYWSPVYFHPAVIAQRGSPSLFMEIASYKLWYMNAVVRMMFPVLINTRSKASRLKWTQMTFNGMYYQY